MAVVKTLPEALNSIADLLFVSRPELVLWGTLYALGSAPCARLVAFGGQFWPTANYPERHGLVVVRQTFDDDTLAIQRIPKTPEPAMLPWLEGDGSVMWLGSHGNQFPSGALGIGRKAVVFTELGSTHPSLYSFRPLPVSDELRAAGFSEPRLNPVPYNLLLAA